MNTPPRADGLKRWTRLISFQKLLNQRASALEPLKATITELADSIGTCEDVLNGRKEYEALRGELEEIFEILDQRCDGEGSPIITATVENLCKNIDREIQGVKEKLNQDQLEQYSKASEELSDLLRCYNRVRDFLQRVSLNIDVSLWKVADELATDNLIDRLQPAVSACYNSARAVEFKRVLCPEGTRADVISQMIGWVGTSASGSVHWMSGLDRAGKTAIAYQLCDKLAADGRLTASFFCSRLLPDCRNVNRIIPSIAYQLARSSRPFRSVLSDILEKNPDAHTHLSHLQFDALIVDPLCRVKHTLPDNLVIVIDALDECENKDSTSHILNILLTKLESLPVKFVVSSPPEPDIWDRMTEQEDQDKSRVVLRELDSHTVVLEFTVAEPQV